MKPLYARLVPFAAVTCANFINIPMMRSTELMNGTPVFTPDGQRVGNSKIAAVTGISLVCISRVAMALPGMTLVPMITNAAIQKCIFCPTSLAIIPFQLSMVCLCVTFATPLCCAFFKQKANMNVSVLEEPLKAEVGVGLFGSGSGARSPFPISIKTMPVQAQDLNAPIDLNNPRWDQSTYMGRAKHFIVLTNPLNFLATDKDLDDAKLIVDEYKKTKKMPHGYDANKLWATKYLVDSAFHPDTGEKMIKIGRMSAQVPMNTLISGCMLTFYKTKPALMFWQWFNQTFNAIVNYTNRSGDAVITTKQLLTAYCAACSGAVSTALYLNSKVKNMNPVFTRLVPFVAVASANFINIPIMRSSELINGTPVITTDGKRVGESKKAASTGILLVCISRVFMAVPGMTLVPLVTNIAVQRNLFCHYPLAVVPFQMSLVCICAIFATPLCCAFFEQRANMNIDALEPNLKEAALKLSPKSTKVYYNKGL